MEDFVWVTGSSASTIYPKTLAEKCLFSPPNINGVSDKQLSELWWGKSDSVPSVCTLLILTVMESLCRHGQITFLPSLANLELGRISYPFSWRSMWEETSNRRFLHNETKAALMSSPNAVTAVESIALWERERQDLKELHTLFLKPEGDLNDVCNLTLCIKQTIGFSWLDPLCLPAISSQTEIRRYTWLIFLEPSSQPRMLSSLTPSQLTSPCKKNRILVFMERQIKYLCYFPHSLLLLEPGLSFLSRQIYFLSKFSSLISWALC